MTNNIRNHISVLSCKEIDEICEPLFKYTPLTSFSYTRLYPDGSRMMLGNHADFMIGSFSKKEAPLRNVHTPNFINYDQPFSLIKRWAENLPPPVNKIIAQQLHNERNLWNMDDQLTISTKNSKYCEHVNFLCSTSGMENFFLNNLELMNKFILYFRNKAHKIIQKADNDRIVKPWNFPDFKINLNDSAFSSTEDINSLEKILQPKKFYLSLNEQEIHFTKSEMLCAELVILGKTAKEIAQILNKSKRTVESQIESIKYKTFCNTKSQLINLLLEHNFFSTKLTELPDHK